MYHDDRWTCCQLLHVSSSVYFVLEYEVFDYLEKSLYFSPTTSFIMLTYFYKSSFVFVQCFLSLFFRGNVYFNAVWKINYVKFKIKTGDFNSLYELSMKKKMRKVYSINSMHHKQVFRPIITNKILRLWPCIIRVLNFTSYLFNKLSIKYMKNIIVHLSN